MTMPCLDWGGFALYTLISLLINCCVWVCVCVHYFYYMFAVMFLALLSEVCTSVHCMLYIVIHFSDVFPFGTWHVVPFFYKCEFALVILHVHLSDVSTWYIACCILEIFTVLHDLCLICVITLTHRLKQGKLIKSTKVASQSTLRQMVMFSFPEHTVLHTVLFAMSK